MAICLCDDSTTVEKTIDELRRLFATCGIPEQIVSDNGGSQFTSEQFAVFMTMHGIRHTRTAPYHPATNGLAERFVQSLKHGLKASLSSGLSLSERLCNFLMLYRSAVHSTIYQSHAKFAVFESRVEDQI